MHGYCECGCGERTLLATTNDPRHGYVKGEPRRFVNGHNRRKSSEPYHEQDGPLPTRCWVWARSTNNKGYGISQGNTAHRAYYEARFGAIPPGLELDHLCSNPRCVNPEHLEAVTHAINIQRGRGAKVTPAIVRQVRASPLSARRLAPLVGLSNRTVADIKAGRSWRNVT